MTIAGREMGIALALVSLAAATACAPGDPPPIAEQPFSTACGEGARLPAGVYSNWNWPLVPPGQWLPRSYNVVVPPQHASGAALPLVLNLHASFNNGWVQDIVSGMTGKAQREGFLAVHPDALGFDWNMETDPVDVEFVRSLLNVLDRKLCFDRRRVHATGYSSGGAMSARLACGAARGELGTHRIASIGPVSAAPLPLSGDLDDPVCPELRAVPVPMRMIVSDADYTIAALYGMSIEEVNSTFERLAAGWASANGCQGDGTWEVVPGAGGRGNRLRTWRASCPQVARADVRLDVFDAGETGEDGHIWPGEWFSPAGDVDATDDVWEFFAGRAYYPRKRLRRLVLRDRPPAQGAER